MSAKKVFGLRVFLFFFDYRKKKEFKLKEIKKVLLYEQGCLGDSVVASGIFKALKENGYEIDILSLVDRGKVIFDANKKYINKVYYNKNKSPLSLLKNAFLLRKNSYDLVINPRKVKATRWELIAYRIIDAKNFFSFDKRDINLFNLQARKLYPELDFDKIHTIKSYEKALATLNLFNQDLSYNFEIPENIKKEVEAFLKENKVDKYICLTPFGSTANRNMSDLQIQEIIKFINENYSAYKIIIIGLPKEVEIFKNLTNVLPNIFDNFLYSIELIRKCELLITTNTSSLHIASLYKKKTLVLYRKTSNDHLQWGANNANALELHGNFEDRINDIKVQDIKEQIAKLI